MTAVKLEDVIATAEKYRQLGEDVDNAAATICVPVDAGKLIAAQVKIAMKQVAFVHNLKLEIDEESSWFQKHLLFKFKGKYKDCIKALEHIQELKREHENEYS